MVVKILRIVTVHFRASFLPSRAPLRVSYHYITDQAFLKSAVERSLSQPPVINPTLI